MTVPVHAGPQCVHPSPTTLPTDMTNYFQSQQWINMQGTSFILQLWTKKRRRILSQIHTHTHKHGWFQWWDMWRKMCMCELYRPECVRMQEEMEEKVHTLFCNNSRSLTTHIHVMAIMKYHLRLLTNREHVSMHVTSVCPYCVISTCAWSCCSSGWELMIYNETS